MNNHLVAPYVSGHGSGAIYWKYLKLQKTTVIYDVASSAKLQHKWVIQVNESKYSKKSMWFGQSQMNNDLLQFG